MKKKQITTGRIRRIYNEYAEREDYEKHRWGKTLKKARDFTQTKKTLERFFPKIGYKNGLEVGCGPGTWTPYLLKVCTKIDLLDISKEMINQLKKSSFYIKNKKKININIADFTNAKIDKKYGLIFSSRAIEYMPNKKNIISKMASSLNKGGKIVIITKNPYIQWERYLPFLKPFVKRNKEIHKDWISHFDTKKYMEEENLTVETIRPATIQFPCLYKSWPGVTISNMLFRLFRNRKPLCIIPFMESYIIIARK
ncbi:MAG: methyltransferase domain-containing protein [Candidatus Woesearchaeota archaeon]